MVKHKILNGFVDVLVTTNVYDGINALMQSSGVGGFRPNTVSKPCSIAKFDSTSTRTSPKYATKIPLNYISISRFNQPRSVLLRCYWVNSNPVDTIWRNSRSRLADVLAKVSARRSDRRHHRRLSRRDSSRREQELRHSSAQKRHRLPQSARHSVWLHRRLVDHPRRWPIVPTRIPLSTASCVE